MRNHVSEFPSVEKCPSEGRANHTVVADLDGTLTRGKSSFPYFMLMAIEGGSIMRALLLLLVAPLAWVLYHFVSEDAGIRVLIFVSFAGLKVKDIEGVARAVLPKFYAEDIHPESWRVFSACYNRCVVTANPRIMVDFFCKNHLGADKVLGTEIQVTKSGRATGLVLSPGVLVGSRKRNAVKVEFGDQPHPPNLGLGDRATDGPFLRLCQEAYMVRSGRNVEAVPMHKLFKPVVFHDGRLVQRPTPGIALMILIWFPIGLVLSIVRVLICINTPLPLVPAMYKLVGIKLTVKGNMPEMKGKQGVLFVCCHRTCLDPVFLSVALRKQVTAVTYSLSRLTEIISPIPTVRLTRNREADAANIKRLLEGGHLVICPEGTTCREPVLLRFSALFAELTDQIVPVAVLPKTSIFYGNTVRGFKAFDVFFFLMNPRPQYDVTFLEQLPHQLTHAGGRSAFEVANSIQKMLAATLGFHCTTFTRRDKYLMLTQNDGSIKRHQ